MRILHSTPQLKPLIVRCYQSKRQSFYLELPYKQQKKPPMADLPEAAPKNLNMDNLAER